MGGINTNTAGTYLSKCFLGAPNSRRLVSHAWKKCLVSSLLKDATALIFTDIQDEMSQVLRGGIQCLVQEQ